MQQNGDLTYNKLKRENEELKSLIGELTLELSLRKKIKLVHAGEIKLLRAEALGINIKNIYRESVLEKKDMALADEITKIHKAHPAYGQKRVAWELNINHKRASRVMSKFGIKPPRRKSKKHWITVSTSAHNYTNLIKGVVADRPNFIFVSDLTYIKFQGKFIYLAEECWTYLQGR